MVLRGHLLGLLISNEKCLNAGDIRHQILVQGCHQNLDVHLDSSEALPTSGVGSSTSVLKSKCGLIHVIKIPGKGKHMLPLS